MSDKKRILLIDNEEGLCRMMEAVLLDSGYKVKAYTRSFQAVEEFVPGDWDLVISDIKMPGMDGLEVARHITAERICGVLILTAFSQREIIEEARDAGALAYLVKPFQKSDLIPAIEVAIGRFREMQVISGERDKLEEQLETRKAIDRAKGILMDEVGMKEQEAFAFIQRTAMSERTKMRDVADRIITKGLRPN